MPADVAGEEARSHGRNFEKNKTGNEAEHEQPRHHRNQFFRTSGIHRSACQIGDEQMAHHAHGRRGDDLVELESEKRLEPAPEEKVSFVEDHPGNEHWPK